MFGHVESFSGGDFSKFVAQLIVSGFRFVMLQVDSSQVFKTRSQVFGQRFGLRWF